VVKGSDAYSCADVQWCACYRTKQRRTVWGAVRMLQLQGLRRRLEKAVAENTSRAARHYSMARLRGTVVPRMQLDSSAQYCEPSGTQPNYGALCLAGLCLQHKTYTSSTELALVLTYRR
jgi:hypothetical protein